jgi:hypothetical protein
MNCLFSLLFIIFLFVSGCEIADSRLLLVNNSNDTVYYYVSYRSDSIEFFPVVYRHNEIDFKYSNVLAPNEKYHVPVLDNWVSLINNNSYDSTLKIFFFNKELVNLTNRDSILKHQIFSKKKKLTVKDLDRIEWCVSYP